MTLLTDKIRSFIGVESEPQHACDAVEAGAVRRYCQAIMNEAPEFASTASSDNRYGGPVAPPLFPTHAFRRPYGSPDPLQERADDPHFDGMGNTAWAGLPDLPLPNFGLLNGGLEIEMFRFARNGERIVSRHRYRDIVEKEGKRGLMLFVEIESDFTTSNGDLLMRLRRTVIRTPT